MQVNIPTAIEMISNYLLCGLVPMIEGSPGIGKSAIVKQIADKYGLKIIDLRLSQSEPTDFMGFPRIGANKAGYVPMETFPVEGDPIPTGYNGWLIFLDEFNGGELSVQKASYKLILDRMVGIHHLHKNVAIVAAGNKETDNAAVEPMNTALQSRLVHLEIGPDAKEWSDWASANGVDHRIVDYINFKAEALYTFSPTHTDKTYACPRTWEFVNRILSKTEEGNPIRLPMIAGAVSEGVAREFLTYMDIYKDLPKISQIEANPEGMRVPEEPSILFALTGSIASNASKTNLDSLIKFVKRLPVEFQVICLRQVVRRNKELIATPAVQGWISTSSTKLF